jgi:hypothetical protein
MATNTIEPGSRPANPSRRAAMGMLAAGAVASLPAIASAASSSRPRAVSLNVSKKIAAYRRAEARALDFHDRIEAPACQAYGAALAAIPHHRTAKSYRNSHGVRRTLTTEDEASVATHRSLLKQDNPPADIEWRAAATELVEAANRREAEKERLYRAFKIEAISTKAQSLGCAELDAFCAVLTIPSASVADLAAKADLIAEIDAWDEHNGAFLLEDIRQLAWRI